SRRPAGPEPPGSFASSRELVRRDNVGVAAGVVGRAGGRTGLHLGVCEGERFAPQSPHRGEPPAQRHRLGGLGTMFNTTRPPTRPIQMPSSPAVPVTSRPVRLTRRAEALSVAAGVLMAVASALGLLVGGLYRDPESTASMLRGYDFVTLLVAVPLLAAALWGVQRGSVRAQLVWIGVLAYAVYIYALYVFGSAFNAAFLLDVAVFSATLAALTLALSGLDATGVA